jgi:MraZ protein
MGGPVMALDAKGRLTVPAHFKEALMAGEQGELIICKSHQRHLSLFPKSLWPQAKRILADLPLDPRTVAIQRMYTGSATPVSVDSGGRILIPAELREYAEIGKDVVFMGLENHFELWDKAKLKEQEDDLYFGRDIKGIYAPLSFAGLQRGA